MKTPAKNKWLIAVVILLLVANITTITLFWMNKENKPPRPQQPIDFINRELGFDQRQKEQYSDLVKEHRDKARQMREEIKRSKDEFFALLQQPGVTDSMKISASAKANELVQQLDILTFNHFQKVRALCTPAQQKKFDDIIHKVLQMMAGPGPGGPPRGPGMEPPPPPRE